MTGTTGGSVGSGEEVGAYLDRVRAVSRPPVLAGFGVRSAEQVVALAPHCDGVIVGSALVEVLSAGEDPVAFLAGLRR
jgi:tryptophan synthase alpha chain